MQLLWPVLAEFFCGKACEYNFLMQCYLRTSNSIQRLMSKTRLRIICLWLVATTGLFISIVFGCTARRASCSFLGAKSVDRRTFILFRNVDRRSTKPCECEMLGQTYVMHTRFATIWTGAISTITSVSGLFNQKRLVSKKPGHFFSSSVILIIANSTRPNLR